MNAETTTNNHARNLVLLAGFTAGLADFLFASITRVMSGGSWMDPWKGVAGCLIGEAAREGGFAIVLLGIALHFFICFSAAAMLESLRPNYALAQQVPKNDSRIVAEYLTYPSPQGTGTMKGCFVRPSGTGKWPGVVVIHENRGLNPYIEDMARRLAIRKRGT